MCGSANFSNLYQDFINSILRGLTLYIGGAGHRVSRGMERLLTFLTPAHTPTATVTHPEIPTIRATASVLLAGLQENLHPGTGHRYRCLLTLWVPSFSYCKIQRIGVLIKTSKQKGKITLYPGETLSQGGRLTHDDVLWVVR